MSLLQVWTGPRCQPDAVCLGAIPRVQSGRVTESVTGSSGLVLELPRAVADTVSLRAGLWLWVHHPRRGTSEWPILSVTTGDGRARDTVSVQGGTIRQALALRGKVRRIRPVGAAITAFTLPALTVAEILRTYLLTNLAADRLTWLSLGTIDYAATITIGAISDWTRGQLLDAIEQRTGYRVLFRRVGDVGYAIDVRDPAALAAEPVPLAVGVGVDAVEQTEDLLTAATVVEPSVTAGLTLGETWWRVGQISGTGPWWVQLLDPTGGAAVLREDDQVNGWWLRPNDGVPVAITDSRASDSSVQVASRDGLTPGTLAALWATSSGAFPSEVHSPSGVASRGRVVQELRVSAASMLGNRITDPALRNALASWEVRNPALGGLDVFGRDDPTTLPLTVVGAVSGGASAVTVSGPANALLRRGDALQVPESSSAANANLTTSETGTATVPLAAALPGTIAASTVLAWRRAGEAVGTATTSGTQSAGASNLVLTGLPATPQVQAGDTLTRAVDSVRTLIAAETLRNTTTETIQSGTALTIVEDRGVPYDSGPPLGVILQRQILTYDATVSSDAAPGDVISYTSGRPPLPTGGVLFELSASYAVVSSTITWTVSGPVPTWDGQAQLSAPISGTVGTTIAAGTVLSWRRGTTIAQTVRVSSSTGSSATAIPLTLVTGATRILVGDTFGVPPQMLYAGAPVALPSSGTISVPLAVATAAGIADGTLITVQRCRDLAPAEFGGPLVLRLRGANTAAPTTYLADTEFAVYSPIMRVESPDPSMSAGAWNTRLTILITTWAAEAAQTASGWWALWDVDTGARLQFGPLATGSIPYTPLFNVATHSNPASGLSVSQSGIRRLRLSLHPGTGQTGNRGAFVFLRGLGFAGLLNSELVENPNAPLVDGSFSNAPWHRAQDLLDASRQLARYRVTLGSVAAGLPDPARLLTAGGAVQLQADGLGVDAVLRIPRLTWSLTDDDRVDLELATGTPRLSESS